MHRERDIKRKEHSMTEVGKHIERNNDSGRKASPNHNLHDKFRDAHHRPLKDPKHDKSYQSNDTGDSHHYIRRHQCPAHKRSHHVSDEIRDEAVDTKKKRRISRVLDWL